MLNNIKNQIITDLSDLGYNKQDILNSIDNVNQRLLWNINSNVYIYSRTNNNWFNAQIINIIVNDKTNEEWLNVKYNQNNKKQIQRFSKDIKAIDCKYEYNQKIIQFILDILKQYELSDSDSDSDSDNNNKQKMLIKLMDKPLFTGFMRSCSTKYKLYIPHDISICILKFYFIGGNIGNHIFNQLINGNVENSKAQSLIIYLAANNYNIVSIIHDIVRPNVSKICHFIDEQQTWTVFKSILHTCNGSMCPNCKWVNKKEIIQCEICGNSKKEKKKRKMERCRDCAGTREHWLGCDNYGAAFFSYTYEWEIKDKEQEKENEIWFSQILMKEHKKRIDYSNSDYSIRTSDYSDYSNSDYSNSDYSNNNNDNSNIYDDIYNDNDNKDEEGSDNNIPLHNERRSYRFPNHNSHNKINSIIDPFEFDLLDECKMLLELKNESKQLKEYEFEMKSKLITVLREMDLMGEGKLDLADFASGIMNIVNDYDDIVEDAELLFETLQNKQDDMGSIKIEIIVDAIVDNRNNDGAAKNIKQQIIIGLKLNEKYENINNNSPINNNNNNNDVVLTRLHLTNLI